jgi:hypothetical protein
MSGRANTPFLSASLRRNAAFARTDPLKRVYTDYGSIGGHGQNAGHRGIQEGITGISWIADYPSSGRIRCTGTYCQRCKN